MVVIYSVDAACAEEHVTVVLEGDGWRGVGICLGHLICPGKLGKGYRCHGAQGVLQEVQGSSCRCV